MGRRLPPWSHQIKELRQKCGLSQRELAAKLGISRKIVADWEQGIQEPSARRYIQLAKLVRGEQALWFLDYIGLDRQFLAELAAHRKEKDSVGASDESKVASSL